MNTTTPGPLAAVAAFALFALIAAGSVLLARRAPAPGGWPSSLVEETAGGRIRLISVAQGTRHASRAEAFRRADIVTVAGRGTLDLREARMAGDRAELKVVVVAGAARVRVPPEWAVVPDGTLALGSIRNRAERGIDGASRTVELKAVVLGGSLEVTH